jgi:hypothetical protein
VKMTGQQRDWRKASACGNSSCVEVAYDAGSWLVRDGKDPEGPVLTFTPEEWRAFNSGMKAGEFE